MAYETSQNDRITLLSITHTRVITRVFVCFAIIQFREVQGFLLDHIKNLALLIA